MPSFDVVSELDWHEVTNAVDQANREITTRYDFKGVKASYEIKDKSSVVMETEAEPQLRQMADILNQKLVNRGIDLKSLEKEDVVKGNLRVSQAVKMKEGLETDEAKKIVKMIKESKIKVQAQIQGDQLRVTGKKRDDLQQVMALLRGADLNQPVQFTNFRD
ncbi:putative nucleotide-binding protein [Marinomonas spartinae]|uniref:Nucleotide-binding protein MSP8886_01579 n=1 Tax=Marinomonas spartinae TaxID=1792290 RepID=A0A1A8TAT3_9GAMM|nr:YajQ family cyclic di-GMP-binding protein [Marinomonas spartinae]SBS29701.1 putative nucleotide-binding protein [Marinomonas spartinae]SBS37318.1 putative nucleotide-binding protein [Marinomonas spartinae]